MSVAQFIYMCESNLHPHTSQSGQSLADNKEQRQESDAATLAPSVICLHAAAHHAVRLGTFMEH
jgi:hypothetical protein